MVKELCENSLDAAATTIEIELAAGGTHLIQVRDNGHGIHPDDLKLALESHATSKLHSLEELFELTSLGFRGEALGSIGSIARLTLQSRRPTEPHGWQIDNQPEGEPKPLTMAIGTTVTVAELFYNTPARRRFLRSERTELLQIDDLLRRLALSHPCVAWSVTHNGKRLWQVEAAPDASSAAQLPRIRQLMGAAFVRDAVELEFSVAGMALQGWINRSTTHTGSSSYSHYLFLNQRMIKDRVLTHAIRQAFIEAGYTPTSTPSYLLHLTLPPAEVDINVHPTKAEVRFRQGRLVHDFIASAIRQAVQESTTLPITHYPPSDLPTPSGRVAEVTGVGLTHHDQPFNYRVSPTPPPTTAGRRPFSQPKMSPPTPTTTLILLSGRHLLLQQQEQSYLIDIHLLRRHAPHPARLWQSIPLLFPDRLEGIPPPTAIQLATLATFGLQIEPHDSITLLLQIPQLLLLTDWPAQITQLLQPQPHRIEAEYRDHVQEQLLTAPLSFQRVQNATQDEIQQSLGLTDWRTLIDSGLAIQLTENHLHHCMTQQDSVAPLAPKPYN